MAASINDKFTKSYSFITKSLSAGISDTDTTIPFNNVTNIPTDTAVHFVIDRVDSSGNPTPSIRELCKGVVSGSNLISCTRGLHGTTAQSHLSGAVVELTTSAVGLNEMIDALLTEHNQDGTHGAVTASSVTVATGKITTTAVSKLEDAGTPLSTYRANYLYDFVYSGGVWTGDSYGSTRNASMTAMVCYINGRRISISAVTARSFTASKDTYVDVLDNADGTGTLVYTEVTNNAASPALASNSIRIAIIVTGAGSIANAGSVNQGQEEKVLPIASSVAYSVTDSLGNLICSRDPNRKILGYRPITGGTFSTASTSSVQVTGLSCPVIVPTGRKVKVTAYNLGVYASGALIIVTMTIWDGTVGSGTQITSAQVGQAAASLPTSASPSVVVTPTSSNKTYNVGLYTASGTASVQSASSAPAYIMVELA